MTKKISRKLRIQGKMHCVKNKGKRVIKVPTQKRQNILKKAAPVIKKLIPPNPNKLLVVISKKLPLKPGQILDVNLENVKIKLTKKSKPYAYFDEVSTISIEKQIYGGRRKGIQPSQVIISDNFNFPKIPGKYNVHCLRIESNPKNGSLIVSRIDTTQWNFVAA